MGDRFLEFSDLPTQENQTEFYLSLLHSFPRITDTDSDFSYDAIKCISDACRKRENIFIAARNI